MGTAFGLVNASVNIGFAFYLFLFGYLIVDNTIESYNNSLFALLILAIIGGLGNVLLFYLAKKNNDCLDRLKNLGNMETFENTSNDENQSPILPKKKNKVNDIPTLGKADRKFTA